jgi:hypothetical protein
MESDIQFHPLEINGAKYLICKLPNEPFSTLHDPATKQIVGQWNNDEAHYEIYPREVSHLRTASPPPMTEEQFEQHMRQLIASGAAFTIVD